jgi:hypothetical protein
MNLRVGFLVKVRLTVLNVRCQVYLNTYVRRESLDKLIDAQMLQARQIKFITLQY